MTSQTKTGNGWGNATIVFDFFMERPQDALYTLNHELGHSLGLSHIFESNAPEAKFYQATTDNLMDYNSVSDEYFETYENPFNGESVKKDMIVKNVLHKFQWEIMHEDESIIFD